MSGFGEVYGMYRCAVSVMCGIKAWAGLALAYC